MRHQEESGRNRGRGEGKETRRREDVADPSGSCPAPPQILAQAAFAFLAASIASSTIWRASAASPQLPIRTHFSDSRSL